MLIVPREIDTRELRLYSLFVFQDFRSTGMLDTIEEERKSSVSVVL